jgi:hypothetical protein
VRNDGTVRKIPLCAEGSESVSRILRNHEELARLGVNVIPLHFDDGYIAMPRLDLPTLWDYWARKLSQGTFDPEEMFRHFDRIRDIIHLASAEGKCYFELVPANCFFDEINDAFIFFDQEYFWENASPEIAVVRALLSIMYSAVFKKVKLSQYWLDTLIRRYSLEERHKEFLEHTDMEIYREIFGGGADTLLNATLKAVSRINSTARRLLFAYVPEKLRNMGYHKPIIYGYGVRGRDFEYAMKCAGLSPALIIDKKLDNCDLVGRMQTINDADVVIVSIRGGASIAEDLRKQTNLPVFLLEELTGENND